MGMMRSTRCGTYSLQRKFAESVWPATNILLRFLANKATGIRDFHEL